MAKRKQKLELTWVGKGEEPRLEPRILIEDPEKSFGERSSGNMLIHGDNLLALKALEQDFAGKVKCIYIDPPYNTGSAFEHYEDGLEHSQWLNLIKPRLISLRNLLSEDGSIWVSIDDNEQAYLKVLMDEVFGRRNFVQSITWMRKASPANDAKWFSNDHDYLLVYAKNKEIWRPIRLDRSDSQNSYYTNPDNDPRGRWNSVTYTCNKSIETRPNLYYPIVNPNTGEKILPSKTAVWRCGEETHKKNIAKNLLYWGKEGKSKSPRLKRFLTEAKPIVPRSVWLHSEVGHTQTAMLESKSLFLATPFATPKNEALLERIVHIASNPGDLVLDSFLGSGTTAAVAHKMGRRWIGIELGDHAETHCLPRLKKVVSGEDQGGISKTQEWNGGGGFRYYELAPSLLNQDNFGQWVINEEYNPVMLAAALAKQEGFKFRPDRELFWKQGVSNEADYIYSTTQYITLEQVDQIQGQLKETETLLVCCTHFHPNANKYANINLKKIPQAVLSRCEFDKDDYSLNIINMPVEKNENEAASLKSISPEEIKKEVAKKAKKKPKKTRKVTHDQLTF